MTMTLGEALPIEMARCRDIMLHAQEIGAAGGFLVMVLQASLHKADKAVMSGDLVDMIQAYQELREYKS